MAIRKRLTHGALVRATLRAKGLSEVQAAKLIECDRSTLRDYMEGRSMPYERTRVRIAVKLNLPPKDLGLDVSLHVLKQLQIAPTT